MSEFPAVHQNFMLSHRNSFVLNISVCLNFVGPLATQETVEEPENFPD
jgi:hypothetical protein